MASEIELLTEKQKDALMILASPDHYESSVADKCKALGVSRKSYYQWLKNDNFVSALDSVRKKALDSFRPVADNSLMNKCREGDVPALKLYYQLVGALSEAATSTNFIDKMQINIVSTQKTTEQKAKQVVEIQYFDEEE